MISIFSSLTKHWMPYRTYEYSRIGTIRCITRNFKNISEMDTKNHLDREQQFMDHSKYSSMSDETTTLSAVEYGTAIQTECLLKLYNPGCYPSIYGSVI